MATLILLADHAHNGLKPGLRPSSPHRRRLASRRGQTPSPGSHGSSRPPRLVASPVGLTLPHRLEGASRSRIPAYPVGVVGAALLTAPPLTRLRGRGARDRLGLPRRVCSHDEATRRSRAERAEREAPIIEAQRKEAHAKRMAEWKAS